MPKDKLGLEIEVGDIIVSAASKKFGNFKIGRVEKVFPSSRVTVKYAYEIPVYAYEQGAPDVEKAGTRPKVDENGRYVTIPDPQGYKDFHDNVWRRNVYEDYTYMQKDYTVVGRRWKWVREQAAENHVLVLQKKDWNSPVEKLNKILNLDYDKEIPEWE